VSTPTAGAGTSDTSSTDTKSSTGVVSLGDGISPSNYLDNLPASFRADPFLGCFLLAFEAVLSGSPDVDQPGLEELIEGLADRLDPATTGADFLPWLAGWVGLSLRADWPEAAQRAFIAEIVPLYQQRGTLAGLTRMLQIYLSPLGDPATVGNVQIDDSFPDPPNFFQVRLVISEPNLERLRTTQETARAIIDREKPAYTFYALRVTIPTMRLVSLQLQADEGGGTPLLILGQNTTLGSAG
jgi:phage tail-like protein